MHSDRIAGNHVATDRDTFFQNYVLGSARNRATSARSFGGKFVKARSPKEGKSARPKRARKSSAQEGVASAQRVLAALVDKHEPKPVTK
jgi:hypothetical protein